MAQDLFYKSRNQEQHTQYANELKDKVINNLTLDFTPSLLHANPPSLVPISKRKVVRMPMTLRRKSESVAETLESVGSGIPIYDYNRFKRAYSISGP